MGRVRPNADVITAAEDLREASWQAEAAATAIETEELGSATQEMEARHKTMGPPALAEKCGKSMLPEIVEIENASVGSAITMSSAAGTPVAKTVNEASEIEAAETSRSYRDDFTDENNATERRAAKIDAGMTVTEHETCENSFLIEGGSMQLEEACTREYGEVPPTEATVVVEEVNKEDSTAADAFAANGVGVHECEEVLVSTDGGTRADLHPTDVQSRSSDDKGKVGEGDVLDGVEVIMPQPHAGGMAAKSVTQGNNGLEVGGDDDGYDDDFGDDEHDVVGQASNAEGLEQLQQPLEVHSGSGDYRNGTCSTEGGSDDKVASGTPNGVKISPEEGQIRNGLHQGEIDKYFPDASTTPAESVQGTEPESIQESVQESGDIRPEATDDSSTRRREGSDEASETVEPLDVARVSVKDDIDDYEIDNEFGKDEGERIRELGEIHGKSEEEEISEGEAVREESSRQSSVVGADATADSTLNVQRQEVLPEENDNEEDIRFNDDTAHLARDSGMTGNRTAQPRERSQHQPTGAVGGEPNVAGNTANDDSNEDDVEDGFRYEHDEQLLVDERRGSRPGAQKSDDARPLVLTHTETYSKEGSGNSSSSNGVSETVEAQAAEDDCVAKDDVGNDMEQPEKTVVRELLYTNVEDVLVDKGLTPSSTDVFSQVRDEGDRVDQSNETLRSSNGGSDAVDIACVGQEVTKLIAPDSAIAENTFNMTNGTAIPNDEGVVTTVGAVSLTEGSSSLEEFYSSDRENETTLPEDSEKELYFDPDFEGEEEEFIPTNVEAVAVQDTGSTKPALDETSREKDVGSANNVDRRDVLRESVFVVEKGNATTLGRSGVDKLEEALDKAVEHSAGVGGKHTHASDRGLVSAGATEIAGEVASVVESNAAARISDDVEEGVARPDLSERGGILAGAGGCDRASVKLPAATPQYVVGDVDQVETTEAFESDFEDDFEDDFEEREASGVRLPRESDDLFHPEQTGTAGKQEDIVVGLAEDEPVGEFDDDTLEADTEGYAEGADVFSTEGFEESAKHSPDRVVITADGTTEVTGNRSARRKSSATSGSGDDIQQEGESSSNRDGTGNSVGELTTVRSPATMEEASERNLLIFSLMDSPFWVCHD